MELPALSAPVQLWWLLLVLPVLFWLAQPPRPRRAVVTAHPAQWRLARLALRRRPLQFRALRWLLLSLAAVLGTLAAARPMLTARAGPDRLVVLVDGSASMAAGGARGPFARAVETVRRRLGELPAEVEVELVQLGRGGLQRWSGPAARAFAEPAAPGGELPAPLRELAQIARSRPGTAVWTLTDGQSGAASLPDVGALSALGEGGDNAAVLGVEVEDHWPAVDLVLRVDLLAFGSGPMSGRLAVTGAVDAVAAVDVVLPAGQRVVRELAVRRRPAGGEVRVELRAEGDVLAVDDAWTALLPPLPQPRIVLRADDQGAVFVRAAARALAEAVGGEVAEAAAGESAGFLLVEGGVGTVPAGSAPMVAFGVADRQGAAVWPAPVVVDWDRREPLLAGLDLSELQVAHALSDQLPEGVPLITATAPGGGTAPLCVLVAGERTASVHFAFRLQDSNLGLLPAFPQFLLRAYRRTQPGSQGPRVTSAPVSVAETDLRRIERAPDRPLPTFASASRELAPWCVLLSLLLLALRAAIR